MSSGEIRAHLINRNSPITFRQGVVSFSERGKFVRKSASACRVRQPDSFYCSLCNRELKELWGRCRGHARAKRGSTSLAIYMRARFPHLTKFVDLGVINRTSCLLVGKCWSLSRKMRKKSRPVFTNIGQAR